MKEELKQTRAEAAGTAPDVKDLSRFEGEGGAVMPPQAAPDVRPPDTAAWKEIVREYQKPSTWRALWQMINTLVPYAFLWYLMYYSHLKQLRRERQHAAQQ